MFLILQKKRPLIGKTGFVHLITGSRIARKTKRRIRWVCVQFLRKEKPVITCPVRFRESWLILRTAASLLFPPETRWTSLSEVPLHDADDRQAGNLDFVIVSYDDCGKLTDFFALEVQAVYISGNIRQAFEKYVENGEIAHSEARPDYLSSSRKRLIPQLLYKGGILKEWGKKMVVVVQDPFFKTLPDLLQVETVSKADLVWLIFDLAEQQRGQPSFLLVAAYSNSPHRFLGRDESDHSTPSRTTGEI
jgi:hypothetical protein